VINGIIIHQLYFYNMIEMSFCLTVNYSVGEVQNDIDAIYHIGQANKYMQIGEATGEAITDVLMEQYNMTNLCKNNTRHSGDCSNMTSDHPSYGTQAPTSSVVITTTTQLSTNVESATSEAPTDTPVTSPQESITITLNITSYRGGWQ
jgi:hypothetical protein